MLDLSGTSDLNPLGYNHDSFKKFVASKKIDNGLINNFSAASVCPDGFIESVQQALGQYAPVGLSGISLVDSKNATGQAVSKAIFDRSEGGNKGGSALYFSGSSHGSPLTLGGMICGWPTATYPASQSDEAAILDSVRAVVSESKAGASPIGAIVIESTQQSSGYVASDAFLQSLYNIGQEFDTALVVDETNTGVFASNSGRFFQYNGPADYVVFGGRTQLVGYFSN